MSCFYFRKVVQPQLTKVEYLQRLLHSCDDGCDVASEKVTPEHALMSDDTTTSSFLS